MWMWRAEAWEAWCALNGEEQRRVRKAYERLGWSGAIINPLLRAGYFDPGALSAVSDTDLLAAAYIGPATLYRIREAVPFLVQRAAGPPCGGRE